MVTRDTAYACSDNYAIIVKSTEQCVGCEHNEEEAKALASYLTNRSGSIHVVRKNGPDAVRESKEIRPGEPFRHQLREEAFVELGIWKKGNRRGK